jgi:hypothetical protein
VNWQHLQAIVWLRWRLLVNQWRRGGTLNAVLMMILAFGAAAIAIPLFFGCLALGVYLLPRATPVHLLIAWDVLVVALLFFWCIGLVAELQRSEPLSLSKLMHLPVSLNEAFLINYLSSLLSLSLIVFLPIMLAFCLALVWTKGILMLPATVLLAAFLLMITALTYQLQGWLASLISNPRRRRTAMVITTGALILLVQLPNLINVLSPWASEHAKRAEKFSAEMDKLERAVRSNEPDSEDLRRQFEMVKQHQAASEQAFQETLRRWERTARFVNMVLPIGWLPLGVTAAAEGSVWPALLGSLGMTLIGTASLWQAYRTTIALYQGETTNRKSQRGPVVPTLSSHLKPVRLLVEARLPGVSEPVSAIALASLRSFLRAPEAKMMLLTPLIMIPIFGTFLLRDGAKTPESLRPFVGIGAITIVLFGLMHIMANQFGFDRDGFRVFVLCPAPRRDILLGKNLAFAPLALGMAAILLLLVQVLRPLRWDHFLAMFPQSISMFLVFCFLTNLLSIYGPVHVPPGSLRPASPKAATVLLQVATIMVLFPMSEALTLLPLGVELLMGLAGWNSSVPIGLILTIAECAAIFGLYIIILKWQGGLLQGREQDILASVTSRAA